MSDMETPVQFAPPVDIPPKKSNKAMFTAIGLVVVLVLMVGGITGAFFLGKMTNGSEVARTNGASTTATVTPVAKPTSLDPVEKTLKALDTAARSSDGEAWDRYWDSTAVAEASVALLIDKIKSDDKSWHAIVERTGGEDEATAVLNGVLTTKNMEAQLGRSPWFGMGFNPGYTATSEAGEGDTVIVTVADSELPITLTMEPREVDGEQRLVVVGFEDPTFTENLMAGFEQGLEQGLGL